MRTSPHLVVLALLALQACSCRATGAPPGPQEAPAGRTGATAYDHGGAAPEALVAYRRGWSEIMDEGRWTAAEASFREASRLDSGFIMGKALVARISTDVAERERLLREIEDGYESCPADSRQVLDVFVMTVRAAIARARGTDMPEDFTGELEAAALSGFTAFCQLHPGEVHLQAERVEWIHRARGAQAALDLMESLPPEVRSAPFFSSYEATLEAELGHMDAAWLALERLVASLDSGAPAIPFVRAQLLAASGEPRAALEAAERAAELDPRHALAARLSDRLRASLLR